MLALSGCFAAVSMAHWGLERVADVARESEKRAGPSGSVAGAAAHEQQMKKMSKETANMTEEEVKERMKPHTEKIYVLFSKTPVDKVSG